MRNESETISAMNLILEGQASRQMIRLIQPDPVLLFQESFANTPSFCDSTGNCVHAEN
jgi:hypothetical protein